MDTTKLFGKDQAIIPKPLRTAHHWETGQELIAIDVGDGILLKSKTPFPPSNLNDAASCLKYNGKNKTLEEMDAAIKKGIKTHLR